MITLLLSCTDQMDGKKAAAQYCNCMKSNNADKQYGYAFTICNAELAKKYRYYRIFYIDTQDSVFNNSLSESTLDSTKKFIGDFLEYRNENNCTP